MVTLLTNPTNWQIRRIRRIRQKQRFNPTNLTKYLATLDFPKSSQHWFLSTIQDFQAYCYCMASVAAPRKQTNAGRRKDEPRVKHGGPRSGAGRPTKRTPPVEQALLQGITLGLSLSRASALVGITSETFAEWCEKIKSWPSASNKLAPKGSNVRFENCTAWRKKAILERSRGFWKKWIERLTAHSRRWSVQPSRTIICCPVLPSTQEQMRLRTSSQPNGSGWRRRVRYRRAIRNGRQKFFQKL